MQELPAPPPVRIQVLYTEGWQNASATADLVRSVAADMAIPIQLRKTLVESEEQAIGVRFVGSPTVLVNGLDIVPAARHHASYGLG